jgi:hypothetical protein
MQNNYQNVVLPKLVRTNTKNCISIVFKYVFFSIDPLAILVTMVQRHLAFLVVHLERMFLEVI